MIDFGAMFGTTRFQSALEQERRLTDLWRGGEMGRIARMGVAAAEVLPMGGTVRREINPMRDVGELSRSMASNDGMTMYE